MGLRISLRGSRIRRLSWVIGLPLLLAATSTCSTSYRPRDSRNVAMVIDRGAITYLRDGRATPLGPLAGGLQTLVADTPAAAEHARLGERQLRIGIPTYLLGAAGVLTGVLILSGPAGWIAIGAGAATLGTGFTFMGSGVTHLIDAVNMHNDAVRERPTTAAP